MNFERKVTEKELFQFIKGYNLDLLLNYVPRRIEQCLIDYLPLFMHNREYIFVQFPNWRLKVIILVKLVFGHLIHLPMNFILKI